jgi:phage I-like protein
MINEDKDMSIKGFTSLSLASMEGNGWQQLLPAGYFSAVDGRPEDVPSGKWFLDAYHANQLILKVRSAINDLVIDYEHQTLNTGTNGQPAPAAGWFKSDIEWREGSGLWIRPHWTKRALNHIRQGEYRFLSAVFNYDSATGIPLTLHSAALVNKPGIDGMQSVDALSAQNTILQSGLCSALSPEEHEVALKANVTIEQYQKYRAVYCINKGKNWEALKDLTGDEKRIINQCGVDSLSYQQEKIKKLASDVVSNPDSTSGAASLKLKYPLNASEMPHSISPEEVQVALKSYVPQQEYLKKRADYCARQGKEWASLSSLTSVEKDIIKVSGLDQQSYLRTKISKLAEKIIYSATR